MKNRMIIGFFLILSFLLIVGCSSNTTSEESSSESNTEDAKNNTSEEKTQSGEPQMVDSLTLTVAGASPNGFWSLIGNGIGSIITGEVEQTQYSYETGNGVKNTIDVAAGKIPLGIAHNFEIKAGLNGEEPYQEKVPEVTAIATLYNNAPFHIVISKAFSEEYGINSIEDIAEKKPPIRVAVNQRGNLLEKVNRIILESYGITYDDIKEWGGDVYYESYKTGSDLMKDNKNDWVGAAVFAPDGKFLELASGTDIKILSINEETQKLLKEKMGLSPGVIKAGTYDFQDKDVQTVNAGALLMVNSDLSNDEVYTITKVIMENIEQYKQIHNNLKSMSVEQMADVTPASLHPGAEAYYKEAEILK